MKFSIITVCFNSAKTIADTIHSVQKQSHKNLEHIIIDGGSVDGTMSIVRTMAKEGTLFFSENDEGIYDAMNKGIELASGDVIGFLNSDDFYPSADILALINKLLEDSGLDSCYADLCYVKKDDPQIVSRYWKSSPMPQNAFLDSWAPPHPTFFVKRKIYKEFGGFNKNYCYAADFDLMLRFLKSHAVTTEYLPQVLVHMRLGGSTNNSLKAIFYQNKEIIDSLRSMGFSPNIIRFLACKIFTRIRQYTLSA